MPNELADMRQDYSRDALEKTHLTTDPIDLFNRWMKEAIESDVFEPNAMTLATLSARGYPTARIVLLKGIENGKFKFFTNYNSHKGQELAADNRASLLFLWKDMQRQVRIEGQVNRLDESVSTAYFQSRPRGSQLGAWASPQSEAIPDRKVLNDQLAAIEERFKEQEIIPKPPHWGGFGLTPNYMEFWQGRTNRLHDRFAYTLQDQNQWKIVRLAP